MENKLILKKWKAEAAQILKSKSDGELSYLNHSNDDQNVRELMDYNNQVNNGGLIHTRNIYALTEFIPSLNQLTLSTFRPLICPMPMCEASTCPSALLQHLIKYHNELPSSPLQLDGSISSCEIFDRLNQMKPLHSTPLQLFIVNTDQYPGFPVFLNACWLNNQDKQTSGRWLAAWISSLYTTSMWFRLQFVGYPPNPSSIGYVCKVLEIRETLTPKELTKNVNVMLLNEKSIAQLYENEQTLYVEINAYPPKIIEVRNRTQVSII